MRNKQFIDIEDNLKLWVETDGNKNNEPCLFISGAGANCSFWSDRLSEKLVENGFFVIKYDHRDFGYSTKIDFDKNPYDLMNLTNDVIAILNFLRVKRAHVIGHSMGGFIVQLLGIHYSERVISMISASASTNSPKVPVPPEKTWEVFMENKPQNNYEEDLNGFLPIWEYLNGTAKFDKELAIKYTMNLYERQKIKGAIGETHVKAQSNLIDRTELLKHVKIPTLVVHGEEDYLVNKYGGIQTADCIEKSELVLIPKMGHMLFNYEVLIKFENEIIRFINKYKSTVISKGA